jgi:hypothetical protein
MQTWLHLGHFNFLIIQLANAKLGIISMEVTHQGNVLVAQPMLGALVEISHIQIACKIHILLLILVPQHKVIANAMMATMETELLVALLVFQVLILWIKILPQVALHVKLVHTVVSVLLQAAMSVKIAWLESIHLMQGLIQ